MKMKPLGLTWRRAFFTLASFAAVSVVIWPVLWHLDRKRLDRLTTEWVKAFEICRTSVELDYPVSTVDIWSASRNAGFLGISDDGITPFKTRGRFVVHEETFGEGPNFRRSCKVELADESIPLDKDEMAAVLLSFIELREQLFASGKHVFMDIQPLPPYTMPAFELRDGNVAGCATSAYININVQMRTFTSVIGERATSPCSAR